MNWTEEQREVIETRDKNILVSAAGRGWAGRSSPVRETRWSSCGGTPAVPKSQSDS